MVIRTSSGRSASSPRTASSGPSAGPSVAMSMAVAASMAVVIVLAGPLRCGAVVGAADPPYRPPTDRAVSRGFDQSHGPYGPGNRGLDYAVQPGDVIRTIASGTVVFAGPVAGNRFVTVLHPDGLRSSYSYLGTLAVRRGQTVRAGDAVGTSSARFQLGIRRGDTYLDPAPLFASRPVPPRHARLVR